MKHPVATIATIALLTLAQVSVPAAILPSLRSLTAPVAYPRPPGVPADEQLERAQAQVGSITITPLPLFDTSKPEEDTSLFRLANRIRVRTRESTIADQLLFKPGDVYRGRLLEESERVLRTSGYLRDAHIRPIAFKDGIVDIEVTTEELWTFNPGLSYSRGGGKSTSGLELEELNLLGFGAQVGIAYKSDVDRDSKRIYYRDRHVGHSWWSLSTQYSDNSDGRLAEVSLDHPFYALDTKWATGFSVRNDRRVDSRYDLGEIIDQFETRAKQLSAYWGRSSGLRNGWTQRLKFGVTYDDRQFGAAPGTAAPLLLPADRKLVYPFVAAEWIQDKYRKDRNRDQIDKTEDYSLGWRARAQLGFASSGLGSDCSATMFSGGVAKGLELSERQTLLFDGYLNGRLESGDLAGTLVGGQARYYFRQSPRRLLFLGLTTDVGTKLDVDQQILLGGDNGLRGYPLRYQAGDGRWLFTAEQRFYSNWYPFRLFNVGGAVFYDMGGSWGRDPLGSASQGTLEDVGFGLRIGNSRSALGNVLHVDVAFPLDGDSSIKKLQFVVETKRSF